MWPFIAARLKAIAALAAPPITIAVASAVCSAFDVPFPDEAKTWVLTIFAAVVSAGVVHQTPNIIVKK